MLWGSVGSQARLSATVSSSSDTHGKARTAQPGVYMCVWGVGVAWQGTVHNRGCHRILLQRENNTSLVYLQAFISPKALIGTEETQKDMRTKIPATRK